MACLNAEQCCLEMACLNAEQCRAGTVCIDKCHEIMRSTFTCNLHLSRYARYHRDTTRKSRGISRWSITSTQHQCTDRTPLHACWRSVHTNKLTRTHVHSVFAPPSSPAPVAAPAPTAGAPQLSAPPRASAADAAAGAAANASSRSCRQLLAAAANCVLCCRLTHATTLPPPLRVPPPPPPSLPRVVATAAAATRGA